MGHIETAHFLPEIKTFMPMPLALKTRCRSELPENEPQVNVGAAFDRCNRRLTKRIRR